MARCVLIVDSNTGQLIDVAGNVREGARYRKFAGRLLSPGPNPRLDYGVNGGNALEISNGGYEGERVDIKARSVNVTGTLSSNGSTVEQMAAGQAVAALSRIKGKDGEISVSDKTDSQVGRTVEIALDGRVAAMIERLDWMVDGMSNQGFVSKAELAGLVEGIDFGAGDTLESVTGKLQQIILNIRALISGGDDSEEPEEGQEEPVEEGA